MRDNAHGPRPMDLPTNITSTGHQSPNAALGSPACEIVQQPVLALSDQGATTVLG